MVKKRGGIVKIIFWIFAILWLTTTLMPLFYTLLSSFKTDQEIFSGFLTLPEKFGFDNYVKAEKMIGILRATFNSLFVSAISIAIMLLVSIMGAYVIARSKVPFKNAITIFLLASLMIPIQSAIIPIVQMTSSLKLNNNLWALSFIYAGINLSLVFFILKNNIEGISSEIDEAATIDGCGLMKTLFYIIVPISKPSIATCSIISFLFVYNELPIANVLITSPHLKPISIALLNLKGDFGTLYSVNFASIIICIVPTIIMYLFAQEKVEKSICSGMLKG